MAVEPGLVCELPVLAMRNRQDDRVETVGRRDVLWDGDAAFPPILHQGVVNDDVGALRRRGLPKRLRWRVAGVADILAVTEAQQQNPPAAEGPVEEPPEPVQ